MGWQILVHSHNMRTVQRGALSMFKLCDSDPIRCLALPGRLLGTLSVGGGNDRPPCPGGTMC
jgi:hypothetical protein